MSPQTLARSCLSGCGGPVVSELGCQSRDVWGSSVGRGKNYSVVESFGSSTDFEIINERLLSVELW